MLCALILHVSGRTYSLTSTPNETFLWNFFKAVLFTLRDFARNLLRGSRRWNIFHMSIFDDWPGIQTQAFVSNKPIHYIQNYCRIYKTSNYCRIYTKIIFDNWHILAKTLHTIVNNSLEKRKIKMVSKIVFYNFIKYGSCKCIDFV